jgi:hypothetical protein
MIRRLLILLLFLLLAGCSDPIAQWGENSRTEWNGRARIAEIQGDADRDIAFINGQADTVQTGIIWGALPGIVATLGMAVAAGILLWWGGRSLHTLVDGNVQLARAQLMYGGQQLSLPPAPVVPVSHQIPERVINYAIELRIQQPEYEVVDGTWYVINPATNVAFEAPPPRYLLADKTPPRSPHQRQLTG